MSLGSSKALESSSALIYLDNPLSLLRSGKLGFQKEKYMLSIVSLDLLTTPEKPSVQKLSSDNDYQVLTLSFAVEQSMPSHKHPNKKVMVHILTGELELASDTERSIVKRGQVAFFRGMRLIL